MAVRKTLFSEIGLFIEQERGSDTLFVQQVLQNYPVEAVEYQPMMKVEHLEIESVRDLYRKKHIYGYSNETSRRTGTYQPLSSKARWFIFKKVVHKQSLPLRWQLGLFLMLLWGSVCYETGRIKNVIFRRLS